MDYYTSIIIITLLALTVLSILISENNRISSEKKRLFLASNLLIAFAAIAECIGVHLSGNTSIPKGALAAAKAIDYTLTPMTGGALIALMQKPNTRFPLLRVIFIGNAILQAVSAFHGWMVVIDAQNRYTHGPLYPLYTALYLLVILILVTRMLAYGKSFRKQNRNSLYATIILIFVGIGIQEVFQQGWRVSYLALAFAETFLFIHYSEFSQLQLDDELSEQQVKLSNDALTGVLSRFAYVEAMKAYADTIPENLAVFLIDINGLKLVNDSAGHEAGDELICGTAACIEAAFQQNGRVFRIGGDEFVVFSEMTQTQIESALSSLKRNVMEWSGEKVQTLSVSVGCVLARDYPEFSIELLVKEADKAMYEQKRDYYRVNGRDRRSSPANPH